MLLLYAGIASVILYLIIVGVAWDYGHSKLPSMISYAIAIPVFFMFAFSFSTLHYSGPPSMTQVANGNKALL